ncbi:MULTISPECIES: site-specific integrase [unclassified Duganella]|uniref:tyrosine-type recombinase/integrase n=1 Tax=unclassified Duganella TaxID=2636909 RepID=UPI001E307179|nr:MULTISPECIES: site-specific integrase [unclassified Duganella]
MTAVAVNAKKTRGYYADGNGLYLQVGKPHEVDGKQKAGSKSWVFRYTLHGKAREMGLGSITTYSLAEAREQARKCRQQLDAGVDPIEHRANERIQLRVATAQRRTFAECAAEYHKLHADGWKNTKHADQWINTLKTYAYPIFGDRDVSDVSKADVLRSLEPIWATKAETASRVRQRIRAVLDWAAARDYRKNHDPHLWDQIGRALPKTKDIKKSTHFAACPYPKIAATIASISSASVGAGVKAAMEFIILTACRSGEARGATWAEIDFENQRWVIPAERMKASKEHRVPLSPRALKLLKGQERLHDELVFPNDKGRQYSDMTFTMALRRLGHEFTVHGFRSTFRDWAAEQTAYPREVCEAALAHVSGKDATEAAYFRSDLFEKRRQLMADWATYCALQCATPATDSGSAHDQLAA